MSSWSSTALSFLIPTAPHPSTSNLDSAPTVPLAARIPYGKSSTSHPRPFPPPLSQPISSDLSPDTSRSRKRDRNWKDDSGHRSWRDDPTSFPVEPRMTEESAEGTFDTPSAYLASASISAGSYRDNNTKVDDDEEGEEETRPPKKRRGLAGSIVSGALSGALTAALFGTAITYTAYQLWRYPALLQQHLEPLSPNEAPPPYAETIRKPQEQSTPNKHPHESNSPSHIPRRVRHTRPLRPRLAPRKSAPSQETSLPLPPPSIEPYSARLPYPLPQFQPLEHDEDGEVSAEDEEMKEIAARFEALIDNGREALLSQPEPIRSTLASSSRSINSDAVNSPLRRSIIPPSTPHTRIQSSPHPRFQTPTSNSAIKSHSRRQSTGVLPSPQPQKSSRSRVSIGGSVGVMDRTPRTRIMSYPEEWSTPTPGDTEVLGDILRRSQSSQSTKGWWED